MMTEPDPPLSTKETHWGGSDQDDGVTQCIKVNQYLKELVKEGFRVPKTVFASTLVRTIQTGLHSLKDILESYNPIILDVSFNQTSNTDHTY